jgi:hypothetical protein
MSIHSFSLSLSLLLGARATRKRELVSLSLSLSLPSSPQRDAQQPPSLLRSIVATERERERHNSAKDEICGRETEREKRERGRCVREKLTKKVKRELRSGTFFFGRKSARKARNCLNLKEREGKGNYDSGQIRPLQIFFLFFFFAFFSRASFRQILISFSFSAFVRLARFGGGGVSFPGSVRRTLISY